jgi:GT2 family glycosyltransferase
VAVGSSSKAHADVVSVVIAVRSTDYSLLPEQLRCLSAQLTDRPVEVIVADNSGLLRLGPPFDWVRIVDASGVSGPAHARNRGVEAASGDVVLFCDADDLVSPSWVEGHARGLESSCLTVGASRPFRLSGGAAEYQPLPVGEYSRHPIRHEGVDVADGANMGIRREFFWAAGGFPEDYERSQDVALSLRLRQLGVSPAFIPKARVDLLVGKRPLRQEMRARRASGRARVNLAHEFGLPAKPSLVMTRAVARTGRALALALSNRGPSRSVTLEASELAGAIGAQGARLRSRRASVASDPAGSLDRRGGPAGRDARRRGCRTQRGAEAPPTVGV